MFNVIHFPDWALAVHYVLLSLAMFFLPKHVSNRRLELFLWLPFILFMSYFLQTYWDVNIHYFIFFAWFVCFIAPIFIWIEIFTLRKYYDD